MYGPISFVLVSADVAPSLEGLGARTVIFSEAAEIEGLARVSGVPGTATLVVSARLEDLEAARAAGCRSAAALWAVPSEGPTERARFRESWQKWPASASDMRLISPDSLREWLAAGLSSAGT
jgi:hypothetical protein